MGKAASSFLFYTLIKSADDTKTGSATDMLEGKAAIHRKHML